MNIKVTKAQHYRLGDLTTFQAIIGSHLYGTNNNESDVDILCLYEPPEHWKFLESFPNYHQFQYDCEETNTDYIYSTFGQFWKNQRSGDSTINSDVILFSQLITSNTKSRIKYCRTYKVIKAYIGFAKRDIQQLLKKEDCKKLFHASRGLYCAMELLNNKVPDIYTIGDLFNNPYSISHLQSLEKECRNTVNDLYEKREIQNYFIPETDDDLYNLLLQSNNVVEFKYK